MTLFFVFQLAYPRILGEFQHPPERNDPHAWFASFNKVNDDEDNAFDYTVAWKKVRSMWYNTQLQLFSTFILILFCGLSMQAYLDMAKEFENVNTAIGGNLETFPFGKFFAKDSTTSYCTSITFEYTSWPLYVVTMVLGCVALVLELSLLFHLYLKSYNGGIFAGCFAGVSWTERGERNV